MDFVNGLLFGLTLQLSVGPVCLAVLHKAISRGFREAFKMVLGVTIIDGAYIAASFLGMAKLLSMAFLKTTVLVAGACILIYFGLRHFLPSKNKTGNSGTEDKGAFLYALKLTAANPLTIVFWAGTFGMLIASDKLSGLGNIITYSLGCITSTVLFLTLVSIGGKYISKIFSEKLLKLIDYGVGIFLIYFGGRMLFKL